MLLLLPFICLIFVRFAVQVAALPAPREDGRRGTNIHGLSISHSYQLKSNLAPRAPGLDGVSVLSRRETFLTERELTRLDQLAEAVREYGLCSSNCLPLRKETKLEQELEPLLRQWFYEVRIDPTEDTFLMYSQLWDKVSDPELLGENVLTLSKWVQSFDQETAYEGSYTHSLAVRKSNFLKNLLSDWYNAQKMGEIDAPDNEALRVISEAPGRLELLSRILP